jgi:Uma2 family endonuclease
MCRLRAARVRVRDRAVTPRPLAADARTALAEGRLSAAARRTARMPFREVENGARLASSLGYSGGAMATSSSPARLDPTDTTRVWSYPDLAAIPDDRNRYEIIDGALVVSPAPRRAHQDVLTQLFSILITHLQAPGRAKVYCAATDVILGERRVVEPDLLAVRAERSDILTDRGVEGVPDLVVEILSPSTARVDRGRKQRLYGDVGVPEYWIADPDAQTLEILTPDTTGVMQLRGAYRVGDTAHSPTFAFEFAVAPVFVR